MRVPAALLLLSLLATPLWSQIDNGSALDFDGADDYLLVEDAPLLSGGPGKSLTVEMWVYPRDTTGQSGLVTKWLNYAWKDWGLTVDHGRLSVSIENDSDDWEYASGELIPNEWTHVAFTYDDSDRMVRIFVNGIEQGNGKSLPAGLPDTDAVIYVGKRGYYERFFNGLIDEIRIWNYARSSAELSATMHLRLAGNEPGLVGYWPLDESAGQVAADLSTNDHPAQLGGETSADVHDPVWVIPNEKPSIELIQPNGGERLPAGRFVDILWQASPTIPEIRIEYSANDGLDWQTIVSRTTNDGVYSWQVLDGPVTAARIRISDADNDSVADVSDGAFSLARVLGTAAVTVNCDDEYELYLNGIFVGTDDQWDRAQTYSVPVAGGTNVLAIRGVNTGGPGGILAEVKYNGTVVSFTDANARTSATEEPGWWQASFDDTRWLPASDLGQYGTAPWSTNIAGFPQDTPAHWIWPDDANVSAAYFRLFFQIDSSAAVGGPEILSFTPPAGPPGTEVVLRGTGFTEAAQVDFNGVAAAFSVQSDSEMVAVVPEAASTGFIHVATSSGVAESPAEFQVEATPGLILHIPNGPENWAVNSVQKINWTSGGDIADVRIEYSVDDGNRWTTVAARVANTGGYRWRIPNFPSDRVRVRVADADNDQVFDTSDAPFQIFVFNPDPVNTFIPNPRTLTIDDVGWKLGRDDSQAGGPFRLGTQRDPVFADYEVLKYVAEKVKTRLSAKFILSEFDRENVLANYPTTTEMGSAWDNSALVSPEDFTITNFMKDNAAWIDLGMHGVRHEYWDWDENDGKMFRAEFYDERRNKPWPVNRIKEHLQAFQAILAQYDIQAFPTAFVPGGEGYYYSPGDAADTGGLLSAYGIKYAASSLIRAGTYGVPPEVIQAGGTIDHGVLWIQEAPMFDAEWPDWNEIAAAPAEIPEDGIPLTHWPNWWAENPDDDFQTGDRFVDWFNRVKQQPDMYVPKNMAQYYSQWLYRKYTLTSVDGNVVAIDNRNMPEEAYSSDLLGNLLLKFALPPGQHLFQLSIDNGAEIVGYYEELDYAYVIFSRLERKEYRFEYQTGNQLPATCVLNDGTYNVEAFRTYPDSAFVRLQMFGTQDVKIKLPFEPTKIVSANPGLVVNSVVYQQETQLLTLNTTAAGVGGDVADLYITGKDDAPVGITVLSPNGGERWGAGSQHEISWKAGPEVQTVRLEYSPDTGQTWIVIRDSLGNVGSFNWTVPETASTSALVRISDMSDSTVTDLSDGVFSIATELGTMEITIDTDDEYELWVNGEFVGSDVNWDVARTYSVPLLDGVNVFAVHGVNTGNPGGLIMEVKVNGTVVFISDGSWVMRSTEASGWTEPGFDDSGWTPVTDHGAYGVSPWLNNIDNFPKESVAHWIWDSDITGSGGYFRGRFEAGALPVIASFSPASGAAGTSVTITGANFTGTTAVMFNGTSADFTEVSDSEINATVPSGATSGPIAVTTSAGTGMSASDFTVETTSGEVMEIAIGTDDEYELWVNGDLVGSDVNWDVAQTYTVPLVDGENVFAVHGVNTGGPGGLIMEVKVNGAVVFTTNGSWVMSSTEVPGWTGPDFDDSAWMGAAEHGGYGTAPWKSNIVNFPQTSPARWIWFEDTRNAGGYFRGHFNSATLAAAQKTKRNDLDSFSAPHAGTIPAEFSLRTAYPNPFNLETIIEYALPEESEVQLRIYNLRGRLVRTLVNEVQPAGIKSMRWDGRNEFGSAIASGVYFVHLRAGKNTFVQKITLQK